MSLGSLRHYFATQSELLAFSMKMVSDRVNARMEAMEFTDHPLQDIERFIRELMPLDEERECGGRSLAGIFRKGCYRP